MDRNRFQTGAVAVTDAATGRWLAPGLHWSDDPRDALVLVDRSTAEAFLARHACEAAGVAVVTHPADEVAA